VLLVGRSIARGVLSAHLAGVLLFALVVAVESADAPFGTLVRTVLARVPSLWAQASAVLGCVGVAGATFGLRRRGAVLALGTLGFDARILLFVGALCSGVAGGAAGRGVVAPEGAPGAWERGDGGWIRDGVGWPDRPGDAVRERGATGRDVAADVLNAAGAGACGAALGLWAGATPALVLSAVLLVVDVVARGLAERGAVPAWGASAPGLVAGIVGLGLLLRAPIFPRRWG